MEGNKCYNRFFPTRVGVIPSPSRRPAKAWHFSPCEWGLSLGCSQYALKILFLTRVGVIPQRKLIWRIQNDLSPREWGLSSYIYAGTGQSVAFPTRVGVIPSFLYQGRCSAFFPTRVGVIPHTLQHKRKDSCGFSRVRNCVFCLLQKNIFIKNRHIN